jgi:hypothetical protein
MAFLRFIVSKLHPDSGVSDGIFATALDLRDAAEIPKNDRETLTKQLVWFTKHLPIPTRFNRSSSKGFYRKNTRGIAWFRDDASEHISRMHEIKRVLEANGHMVHILREDRVGYIVYSDEAQVVAEPFADTRTDP